MELSEPTGKNDGSVKGVRYFSCKANHGIFVKENTVSVVPVSEKILNFVTIRSGGT